MLRMVCLFVSYLLPNHARGPGAAVQNKVSKHTITNWLRDSD
jgi:hypothetical protein